MPKRTSTKIPGGALVLRTYADLRREVDAFAHGERNLLVVVGPPGMSKSTTVRHRLADARVIQGGSTPYRLYLELYEHRDRPVVLDDADKIFRHRDGVFLLKLLTQTDPVKTIQWNSNTAEIRNGDVPSEFATTSRTLILANGWPRDDPDIAAVESRGHLLYFAPSFAEMHAFAAGFVRDAEVYAFVGEHLHLFDRFDLRVYHKAAEVKATGERTGDREAWKGYVRGLMVDAERRAALELMRDAGYPSDHRRAAEFARITGMSSRAFYRLRDDLRLRHPEVAGPASPVKAAS